jgi:hypothetical protein
MTSCCAVYANSISRSVVMLNLCGRNLRAGIFKEMRLTNVKMVVQRDLGIRVARTSEPVCPRYDDPAQALDRFTWADQSDQHVACRQ